MVLVCPRPEGHCQDEQGTVQRRDLLPRNGSVHEAAGAESGREALVWKDLPHWFKQP